LALAPCAQRTQQPHVTHNKAAGYTGPWIENEFIQKCNGMYDEHEDEDASYSSSDKHDCLSDYFLDPFVPPFIVLWDDVWIGNRFNYPPKKLAPTLARVLGPDVAYIAVSQNDDGLPGRNPYFGLLASHFYNIVHVVMMSAGG
jgi:hypothetical protein